MSEDEQARPFGTLMKGHDECEDEVKALEEAVIQMGDCLGEMRGALSQIHQNEQKQVCPDQRAEP